MENKINSSILFIQCILFPPSIIGMLAVSPLLTNLIISYGWRIALRIIAGGLLVSGLASVAFLKNPPLGDNSTDTKCPPEKTARGSGDEKSPETTTWLKLNSLSEECINNGNTKDMHSNSLRLEEEEREGEEEEEEKLDDLRPGVKSGLEMVKHLDPWAYFIATILALLGWTFFIINFVSSFCFLCFLKIKD